MLKKISEKISKIKHKELIFFVLIIVLIIIVFIISNSTDNKTASVSYEDMSPREEVVYRITEAVNALTGDDNSKIIVYWDSEKVENTSASLGSLFNSTEKFYNENLKILGVAVVCKDGNDAQTKVKISFMLSNVFGIDVNRISVLGKK